MKLEPVPIPLRLRSRPIFQGPPAAFAGLPVPVVVLWIDGVPDFRAADMDVWMHLAKNKLCSLCGQPLKKTMWFIGGANNMKQRLFFDLPTHLECALYSFKVCPYLAMSTSQYSKRPLPQKEGTVLLSYHSAMSAVRPERIGLAPSNGYTIGEDGNLGPGHYLVEAKPWLREPIFLKDRAEAERWEKENLCSTSR